MNAADVRIRLKTEDAVLEPLAASPGNSPAFYLAAKRLLDIVGAALGIVLLSPLLLGLAIAVRATSKGSAIYRQARVGRDGRTFQIYKFRTMVEDADNLRRHLTERQVREFGRMHKLEGDPRVTPFGAMLRRTSMDELPQLFNILCGQMSLVGPRPVVREELKNYEGHLHAYYAVKPGLTGMWQVNGRSDTTYAERVALDEAYYRNRSLRMDLQILFKTVRVVYSRKGAR